MTPVRAEVEAADREDYWRAVSDADTAAAHAVAQRVLARGASVEDLLEHVVEAQRRIGELWATHRWSVAREHAATAVSEAVVHRVADGLPAGSGPLLLVACVEREWHAMPALVLTTVLRARGLAAEYAGASTSRDDMVSAILDRGPRAVLLSASLSSSLPRLRRQVEAVRGTGTPVLVGGRAFDSGGVRARRLGATAYAGSPAEALQVLAGLPRHVDAAPPLSHRGATEARTVQARADAIARDVLAALDLGSLALPPDDWRVVLATHTPHVVDSLVGALLCDDASVLVETRAWLREVLTGRGGDPASVDQLWEALARQLRDFPAALAMVRP